LLILRNIVFRNICRVFPTAQTAITYEKYGHIIGKLHHDEGEGGGDDEGVTAGMDSPDHYSLDEEGVAWWKPFQKPEETNTW